MRLVQRMRRGDCGTKQAPRPAGGTNDRDRPFTDWYWRLHPANWPLSPSRLAADENAHRISHVPAKEDHMAKKARKRKYSKGASEEVENEMHRYKRGKAKSGPGGKGGKVKSRKQAIAIGLSKARKKGKKAPKKRKSKKSA
jgi:hypothetical protein